MDTEVTYFDPLNIKFLVEAVVGIRVLKVLRVRDKRKGSASREDDETQTAVKNAPVVLICGAMFNLAFVALLVYVHQWVLALAWCAGMLVFFPFFGAIRQLLEHRSTEADPAADYRKIEHGAVHRMFGEGPLASTFGGAGFNRHLLHHWDPGLSYTRLGDLERYLLKTDRGECLKEYNTTYRQTFQRLFRAEWR
jgi:fatty acid desaturase